MKQQGILKHVFCVIILVYIFISGCKEKSIYLDENKPTNERIENLLSFLTIEEKINFLCANTDSVSRLNIPAYN
jgi:hypothetical protein